MSRRPRSGRSRRSMARWAADRVAAAPRRTVGRPSELETRQVDLSSAWQRLKVHGGGCRSAVSSSAPSSTPLALSGGSVAARAGTIVYLVSHVLPARWGSDRSLATNRGRSARSFGRSRCCGTSPEAASSMSKLRSRSRRAGSLPQVRYTRDQPRADRDHDEGSKKGRPCSASRRPTSSRSASSSASRSYVMREDRAPEAAGRAVSEGQLAAVRFAYRQGAGAAGRCSETSRFHPWNVCS